MENTGLDYELLSLTLSLWTEAMHEHVSAHISECPACWKAHLADLLWRNVTNSVSPVNYQMQHIEAAGENDNVRHIRFAKTVAA